MPLTERDINIPYQNKTRTPPASKTPQPHSKLPRLVITPNSAPAAATWSPRIAERTAFVEWTASAFPYSPARRNAITSSGSAQKQANSTANAKPLPQDKALPPRPVARLSSEPSPSKDSRCLIDACEQPLHITSVSGDKREWPALRPQPSRSPSATSPGEIQRSDVTSEPSASSYSGSAACVMAASAQLANVVVGNGAASKRSSTRSSRSPASSYVSATENSTQIAVSYNIRDVKEDVDDHLVEHRSRTHSNASMSSDFPARQASLRDRISNGNLITPMSGSKHQVMTLTDFTRANTMSPASDTSRTHSPSPASFSRPRPGSLTSGTTTPRAMKTASRIPIPDSKKATMVDVKSDQARIPTMLQSTALPTFGNRRIASPEALKILENGKMRRQMQRTPTDTNSDPQIRGLKEDKHSQTIKTPSLLFGVGSSPASDRPMNSSKNELLDSSLMFDDEMPPPTPSDKSWHFPGSTRRSSRTAFPLLHQYPRNEGLTGDVPVIKAPPQTSHFVAPLETIPSEAVLPVDPNQLNDDTKEELVRTLSHLEGKGSPPTFDVDNDALSHMFSHLRGLDRNPHNSSAFVQNVAAAEKFLAMRGSSMIEANTLGDAMNAGRVTTLRDIEEDLQCHAQTRTAVKKQTIASKWSDSTPSDKALSPPSDDVLQPPVVARSRPKSPSMQGPVSIGYPSRIPSRIVGTPIQTLDDTADVASIHSRRSSPTLRKPKPGSVRAAREGLKISNASFARTTAAAESKKSVHTPNSTSRAFSIPEAPHRGRMTVIERPRSRSDGLPASKTRRSHSKSRYVLDKINGIFSGKREKRSQGIPPVPRIEESRVSTVGVESDREPPPPLPVQAAQLPKMPSLSPPSETIYRSNSRASMRTGDTTLVDSISIKDETQCVHALSEHLIGKARREANTLRKERLLTFAKVLNDSLISVREAAISAETAQHAAKSAQVSYEMTQKSLAIVQRLATTVARSGSYSRR